MKTRTLSLFVLAITPAIASADGGLPADPEAAACRVLMSPLVEAEIARALQAADYRRQIEQSKKDQDERSSFSLGDFASKNQPKARPSAGLGSAGAMAPPAAEAEPAMDAPARSSRAKKPASAASDAASGPGRYSKTNTQEESVDEGDIVKTNGRLIVHASCSRDREASACRNELRIFSSWPAKQTRLLSRYEIPGRGGEARIQQLYLHGEDVAILLSEPTRTARLMVIDVSNPASPRLSRETEVDGGLIESRMIGSKLYLATTTPAPSLPAAMIQDIHQAVERGQARSSAQVFAAILPRWKAHLERDPGLPKTRELGTSWDAPSPKPIYRCSDVNLASTIGGDSLLNLVKVDLSAAGRVEGAGVSGYGAASAVYASEGAFYVSAPTAPNGQPWSSATLIRKFAFARDGKPQFEASGLVRGHPLNQFSFSEHRGDLRVATSDQWTSNNLYVLRSENAQLRLIGRLENLGRNERIFAVRMMGDRGYMVTFRRTDPLYTLDLSDPTEPKMIGELKIDGFSNYLHPLGRDHLLAIGQDADQWGRPTGLHLQIFDVSDPRRPTRKFHEKLEAGTTSDAQNDHHAFMFEPETNTLSVPWKSATYWGLLAYRVDPREGFVNLGRVNHALMYKQHFQKVCARADVAECGKKSFWYGFVTRSAIAVDRIIAIDDQLYSLSPSGLMIHKARRGLPLTKAVLVTPPAWRPDASPIAAR